MLTITVIIKFILGILYQAELDPDSDLQKKQTPDLEKAHPIPKLILSVRLMFDKIEGANFYYDNSF